MKKIVVCLYLLLFILMAACTSSKTSQWDWTKEVERPFLSHVDLQVYEQDGMYAVVIQDNGQIIKGVNFSSDRSYTSCVGLQLIEIGSVRELFGMSLEEVKNIYGEFHCNTDSGAYIPAYVSADGYLIRFGLTGDIVTNVAKIDLLSGELVENYQSWNEAYKGYIDP